MIQQQDAEPDTLAAAGPCCQVHAVDWSARKGSGLQRIDVEQRPRRTPAQDNQGELLLISRFSINASSPAPTPPSYDVKLLMVTAGS